MIRQAAPRIHPLALTAWLLLPLGSLACGVEGVDDPASSEVFQDAELAFPGERGTVRTGMFATPDGPRELTYHDIQGVPVFEGDIILTPLQEKDDPQGDWPGVSPQGTVRARGTARWKDGIVPYRYSVGLDTLLEVLEAIDHWETHTPIRFVVRSNETDYVTFAPGSGCSSSVGRVGGEQVITLEDGCSTGNTIHEIGHALGLLHEQSRTDRDDHIFINWFNIEPGKEHNFDTYVDSGSDGKNAGPYDIESIMHYGSYAFAVTPYIPTIQKIGGDTFSANRTAVTATDICTINRYYGFGKGSDFNGDGYADLATGVPLEDLSGGTDQGAVMVLNGSASGVTSTSLLIHRDQPNVSGVATTGDQFGFSIAYGDFNGDCYADLAVGVPYDDVGGVSGAGSVQVFYGSSSGLDLANDQVFRQDDLGGDVGVNDHFGFSLTTGDFNGDGYDDLVMGAPYESLGAAGSAGSVNVVYGSVEGLDVATHEIWNQDTGVIQDTASSSEQFGRGMAAGDFNDDGFGDLAVGVPYQADGGVASAGAVHIIYGSIDGLSDLNNQLLLQSNGYIPGNAVQSDHFGWSLTSGDFDSDGYADLAVGVPDKDVSGVTDSGGVIVFYGATGLLATIGSESWSQGSSGIIGLLETGDQFGRALTSADFDMDGYADLAIGAPYEDLSGASDAGGVNLILGSSSGLASTNNQHWTQSSTATDSPETLDLYGLALGHSDYNGDGRPDLAIGVPYEDLPGAANMGAVSVLRGSTLGLTGSNDELWSQDSSGVVGVGQAMDLMGNAL